MNARLEPWNAWTLLRAIPVTLGDAKLRGLLLRAVLVNAFFLVLLLGGALWGVLAVPLSGLPFLDHDLLRWIVRLGLVIAVLFATPVLLVLVNAILLPIHRGRLFARARELAGAPLLETNFLTDVKSIGVEVRRLLRFLVCIVLLLPLNLIPFLGNALYVILQTWLAARTMGWDLLGHHFEIHDVPYREQKRWIAENRLGVLTLGLVGILLILIPIAQFFLALTNVVGAGLLSARMDRRAAR